MKILLAISSLLIIGCCDYKNNQVHQIAADGKCAVYQVGCKSIYYTVCGKDVTTSTTECHYNPATKTNQCSHNSVSTIPESK